MVVVLLSIVFINCSKDEDSAANPTGDCQTDNYGIVQFNFSDVTARHGITATENTIGNFRDKTVNVGVATDTMHLAPGVYTFVVNQVNQAGEALDQPQIFTNRLVQQCETQTINTSN